VGKRKKGKMGRVLPVHAKEGTGKVGLAEKGGEGKKKKSVPNDKKKRGETRTTYRGDSERGDVKGDEKKKGPLKKKKKKRSMPFPPPPPR